MYVRPQELEYLLWHCDELQEMLKELKMQIEKIKFDGKEAAVYSAATNRNFGVMPGTGQISDRTSKIALNIPSISGEYRKAFRELRNEINQIGMVIDKLELAKRMLSPAEQKILNLRYGKSLTFQDIATKIGTSKAKAKTIAGQALEQMVQACRIEQNEYEEVLSILKEG